MEKYGFTVALLPVEVPLSQLLKLRPDWRVVEDDGKRILLVHRATSVPPTGNLATGTKVLRGRWFRGWRANENHRRGRNSSGSKR